MRLVAGFSEHDFGSICGWYSGRESVQHLASNERILHSLGLLEATPQISQHLRKPVQRPIQPPNSGIHDSPVRHPRLPPLPMPALFIRPSTPSSINNQQTRGLKMLMHATIFQVMNGIVMLLDEAPLGKAALHQMSGVLVLTSVVHLLVITRTPHLFVRRL